MTNRGLQRGIAVAGISVSLAAGACGDVVYDSFGPGGSTTGLGWYVTVGGDSFGVDAEMANTFTVVGGDYLLQSIALPLWAQLGGSDDVVVSVYEDNGGVPGTLLDTVDVMNQVPFRDDQGPLHGEATITAMFSGNALLTAGNRYWVGVAETGPGTIYWSRSDSMEGELLISRATGSPNWQTPSWPVTLSMTVSGTLVPAPSAAMVFASLAFGLSGRRRR